SDVSAPDERLSPAAPLIVGDASETPPGETPDSESAELMDSPARLPAEGPAGYSPLPHTLELLLDVRINVSVEVGRVQMPVRQVMELGPGAVIELERSASEPVEIPANGRCIGRGERVVGGEPFGVGASELGRAPA